MWRFILALVAKALKNSSISSTGKLPIGAAVELTLIDERGAAARVDRHLGQALVHGHDGPAIAVDAALVAERLFERLAEHDADIFDGVVGINCRSPAALMVEIDQAMAGEQVEHVVEESDAGLDLRLPVPSRLRETWTRFPWSGGRSLKFWPWLCCSTGF